MELLHNIIYLQPFQGIQETFVVANLSCILTKNHHHKLAQNIQYSIKTYDK